MFEALFEQGMEIFLVIFFGEIGKGKWKRGTNTPKVVTGINHIVSKLNHSCTF